MWKSKMRQVLCSMKTMCYKTLWPATCLNNSRLWIQIEVVDWRLSHRVKLRQSLTRINQTAMGVSKTSSTTYSLAILFRWKNEKLTSQLAITTIVGEDHLVTNQVSLRMMPMLGRVRELCKACLANSSSTIRSLSSNATSLTLQITHTCSKQVQLLWSRNLLMQCGRWHQRTSPTLSTRRTQSISRDHRQ